MMRRFLEAYGDFFYPKLEAPVLGEVEEDSVVDGSGILKPVEENG